MLLGPAVLRLPLELHQCLPHPRPTSESVSSSPSHPTAHACILQHMLASYSACLHLSPNRLDLLCWTSHRSPEASLEPETSTSGNQH